VGFLSRIVGLDAAHARMADERAALDVATEVLYKKGLRLEALEKKLQPQITLEAENLRLRATNDILRGSIRIQRSIAIAAQTVLSEHPATLDTDALRALRAAVGTNVFTSHEVKS
jgi:hypothetical protein